ncbi:MAG: MBL fold metallo-hydrolase [Deferrisomatales bacterium]
MADKLFLEVVRSPGLAHLSYMVGHGGLAAVIDARRDCEPYLALARERGCRIAHIFETHRNEDYITGSVELQRRTGAEIHHGRSLDWGFGREAAEGDEFRLGAIRLRVLETPGHTDESLSLTLADTSFAEEPVAVFTGDALFLGDVGRTDFYPERAREVAGLLYVSIFEKLLPLGDHVLLYPAHGAGSVCGSGMASREFSTLGYERRFNPALQAGDREVFIERKLAERHTQPPYFRLMERYNQRGDAPVLSGLPEPQVLTPDEFEQALHGGAVALDVREPEAFAGAFLPGSLNIPLDMLAAYAGWLLPPDRDLLLVTTQPTDVTAALQPLRRIGYDRVAGYLGGGMHAWETSGRSLDAVGVVTARQLVDALEGPDAPVVLDVRKAEEFEAGHLPGAVHVFLGHLPERLDEVPKGRPVVTFCGSGRRASIAASILKRSGYPEVANNLGSVQACRAVGCELVED